MNTAIQQVKEAIRHPYAWPGGYPVYVIMRDGEMLCRKCARDNFKLIAWATKHNDDGGWAAAGSDVYWEGMDIPCCNCGTDLESAYGGV